jgi:hypothetical protein
MTKEKSTNNLDDTLPQELKGVVKKADAGLEPVQNSSAVKDESNQAKQAGAKHDGDKSISSEQGVKQQPTGDKSMAELTKEDIRKEVEAIFAQKDSQTKVEARISGLEGEKTELSRKLAEAQAANQDLASKAKTAEEQLNAKEENSKALAKEKDEALKTAAEATKQLDEIRAEQTLAARKQQLAEASILFADAAKQTKQLEKVKAMSDEVFATYKTEMVEAMEIGKASVKPADTAPASTVVTPEVKPKEMVIASKEEELPPPENLTDGEVFRRSIAAAQDVKVDENQVSLYAQM